MSISVDNTKNINTPFLQSNKVAFRATSVQTLPNDTLEISTKKKGMSRETKWGIGIGSIALALIGGVIGIRKYKANYIDNAQKLFKEMFFNKDITREQTIDMLKKYQEISKIQDKEEYIKALFEETRKNHKLGKDLKLEFWKEMKNHEGGENYALTDTIALNPNWSRENLTNAVFHELRHAKQDYFAINTNLERFYSCANVTSEKEKAHILPYLQRKCGITTFSKDNVPTELNEYVENCFKGYGAYKQDAKNTLTSTGYNEYRANFLEQDAWKYGDAGEKLIKDWRLQHIKE